MATDIRCPCLHLHRQSRLPYEGPTRNNECFAVFCSRRDQIFG